MPLMSTSLKAELESSRPMNEENIIELMNQLSCASQYLADNNVVHKDIRPSNIMVEKLSGRIQYKLSDFGSVKGIFVIFVCMCICQMIVIIDCRSWILPGGLRHLRHPCQS